MLSIINGFRTLKILVDVAAPRKVATDRTVKIQEIVETIVTDQKLKGFDNLSLIYTIALFEKF